MLRPETATTRNILCLSVLMTMGLSSSGSCIGDSEVAVLFGVEAFWSLLGRSS